MILPVFGLLLPGLSVDSTEMAPAMRGDAQVRYSFGQERTLLMEEGERVGQRTLSTHRVDTWMTFNPVKGAGLFLQLPATADVSLAYGEARSMGFDPANDSGSMLDSEAIDNPNETRGSGLEGTWIGLRGSPFHEELYAERGDRSSWVFELGYRFADKTNFYSLNDEGERGAGPGASAWLLRGAFSTTHNRTQPYLDITWISSRILTMDIVDNDGEVLSKNVDLRPESTLSIRTGAAFPRHQWGQGANSGGLTIDPHLEFGLRSWQDIPSGTYLPDVLDASAGQLATQTESVFLAGGLDLDIRVMEYLEIDLGAEIGIRSAHQIEHFYPIHTSMGTLTWGASAALRFRARDPLFDETSRAPRGL